MAGQHKAPVSSNWKALSAKIRANEAGAPKPEDTTISHFKSGKEASEELWFEVDDKAVQRSKVELLASQNGGHVHPIDLFPKISNKEDGQVGKYLAIDCEMVGVGPEGSTSALARISLVNFHGQVIMDRYVRPVERIVDYRTEYSGIRPHHMKEAVGIREVQDELCQLLEGKILVGHSLVNDFKVLFINHPRRMTRDTAKYRPFRTLSKGKTPSLKRLAQEVLSLTIQTGEHDSVDDARVAMLLYRAHKDAWENYLFRGEGKAFQQKKRTKKQDRNNRAAAAMEEA